MIKLIFYTENVQLNSTH